MALDYNVNLGKGNETGHVINMLTLRERTFPRKRPYASGAGFCPTQCWFHANKAAGEYVLSPTGNLFQGIGNGVEDRLVEGFEAHEKLLGKQVKLPNPPPSFKIDVGGYIDLVALDHADDIAAYEVKTSTNIPPEPKTAHFAQAMTYACLGGFDKIYIVYVSRTVQNFPDPTPLLKSFQIDVQANLLEYMTTIVMSCHHMHDREAPQRPSHFRKSRECQFCDFQQQCWGEVGINFGDFTKSLSDRAAAERIASELIELRPSFYAAALSNAKGGSPAYAIKILDEKLAAINSEARGKKVSKRTARP